MAEANGGGGLWWPELLMEVACMHVWPSRRALVLAAVLRPQIR
jgi:hypothetical protein